MFSLDKLLLETVINNNNNITDMYIIVCACNHCVTVVEAIYRFQRFTITLKVERIVQLTSHEWY